jgi:acetoin utilization deacetylase AcuC-like enzyme
MPLPVGLVFDDRFLAYNMGTGTMLDRTSWPFPDPVPHWSGPELVARAKQLLDMTGTTDHLTPIRPFEATDEQLLAYHTAGYLERLVEVERIGGDAGAGAPLHPGGLRIARLAAGGAVAAVDAVFEGRVGAAHALTRPAGHHAMADQAMGFCVFNNVVIAARHAQRAHGVERIIVLDWDVHHGNGTQDAFWSDPSVLFVSIHQDGNYPPGWGAVGEVGEGDGRGTTVNIPLPAGSGGAAYLSAFDRVVEPIARAFAPGLILISAGQDASIQDPLGRMLLTTDVYREMTRRMMAVAEERCGGRLVLVQEGGYAPTYAPYCTAAIVQTLLGDLAGLAGVSAVPEPYGERAGMIPPARRIGLDATAVLDAVVDTHWPCWPALRPDRHGAAT